MSESTVKQVFFDNPPPKFRGQISPPKFGGLGCQGLGPPFKSSAETRRDAFGGLLFCLKFHFILKKGLEGQGCLAGTGKRQTRINM